MFVAPTEPTIFTELGVVSSKPEEYGADFMWDSELGLVGVQRKQFPGDFLASIHDGRLNREYQQMQGLDIAVLLLEGRGRWSANGHLIEDYGNKREPKRRWTRSQHRNYLASVQTFKNVQVQQSESKADTVVFLTHFKAWSMQKEHQGLLVRPAAQASGYWAQISNRDFQRHLLQGLPFIGPKLANAILDKLGMIFKLGVTFEDLLEVPGIGPGRAKKIMDVFNVLEPE